MYSFIYYCDLHPFVLVFLIYNTKKPFIFLTSNISEEQHQLIGSGMEDTTTPQPPTTTASPTPEGNCDWAALSAFHTMLLKANTECQINNMGLIKPGEKELILKIHNDFRSKVGKGTE